MKEKIAFIGYTNEVSWKPEVNIIKNASAPSLHYNANNKEKTN